MPHSIQKVFLTRANGFVACHILSDLIKAGTAKSVLYLKAMLMANTFKAGYLVTASVRSKTKSQEILEVHPE